LIKELEEKGIGKTFYVCIHPGYDQRKAVCSVGEREVLPDGIGVSGE